MINRILLLSVLLACFATTTIAQHYTQANLLIDYEGSNAPNKLTTETQKMLQVLLENALETQEIVQIEITAHAENRDIGEARLKPFAEYFEEQGIPLEKLELVTQVDDYNRVYLKIISSAKLAPSIVEDVIKAEALVEIEVVEDVEDVSLANVPVKKVYCTGASKKAEVFSIGSQSNVVIKGKEGTEVNINRRDLVYEDGQSVQEPIQVELKEFYTPKDILLAELHTMEGDKVLETGGMLNLKITANGKPLSLRSGKSAQIKMPTKSAKTKKGMNLYFGKRMANGAVDWNLQKRSQPTKSIAATPMPNTSANAEFNPTSYIQLKTNSVIDSITSRLKVHVKAKNAISNNYPNYSRERVVHSHEEEYFDLELPYLNPNIVDGVWVNVDKRIQDPFAPKPIEVQVQVNGVPNQGLSIDGEWIAYTPRVSLMLKSQAVFLRGNKIASNSTLQEQQIQFENVPKNEEVVLVAFLDTGKELLFASQSVTTGKQMDLRVLDLKPLSKVEFSAAMTAVAN